MSAEHQSTSGIGHLSAAMTTTIMVVAVIVVFLLFIFALLMFLHAKKYWGANPAFGNGMLQQHVSPTEQTDAAVARKGLDPASIKALSSFVCSPENFKEGVECSVCLSELLVGEEARLLPRCGHGFHVECIDMWFQSHSTCPLCRSPVIVIDSEKIVDSVVEVVEVHVHNSAEVIVIESAENLSTEAAETVAADSSTPSSSLSSLSKKRGTLRRIMSHFSSSSVTPLPVSSNAVEEMTMSSMLTLQSLQRLMRGVSSPRNPVSSNVDIEQGNSVPKTLTSS